MSSSSKGNAPFCSAVAEHCVSGTYAPSYPSTTVYEVAGEVGNEVLRQRRCGVSL
jgi:hypothetical protein